MSLGIIRRRRAQNVEPQSRPVRRKVAVKVLKPGAATEQALARFEAERQALALLDHPNIAHVYDAGETNTPLTGTLPNLTKSELGTGAEMAI